MDKETITKVFDKFVDDKFTDAEEELKDAFIKDRDAHLAERLGLEQEEPEDEKSDKPFTKKKKKKNGDDENDDDNDKKPKFWEKK